MEIKVCWFLVSLFFGFLVAWLLGFLVSWCPGFLVSKLQRFKTPFNIVLEDMDPILPNFHVMFLDIYIYIYTIFIY